MTDRYEEIRKALEMVPTNGPWKVDKELGAYSWQWLIALDAGDRGRGIGIAETRAGIGQETANAAHIAACDPDTIRELLAERDQLAAEIEALRELEEREQRDEALLRQALEVLSRAHQTAMEQTLRARVPECSAFAGIAQDLDFVVAAMRERLGKGMEQQA